ncbi:MAG: PTS lactose/cellobiose transporter subunit IIA [Lachnospiraceae bacterium]
MKESMTEKVIMELVVNSGNARSLAMEAIQLAKKRNFQEAENMLENSQKAILKAHEFQTELVSKEAAGEEVETSLIMCHGQDHLMTAMVIIDLAAEFIDVYKSINKNKIS